MHGARVPPTQTLTVHRRIDLEHGFKWSVRQQSAQCAATMSRQACQLHLSEVGQAYSRTVTESL